MKIAILSSHTPTLFYFRLDMMHMFGKLGYEVVAIGNEDEKKWSQQFLDNGIKYRAIKIDRNRLNPLNDLSTVISIKNVLQQEKPDKIFVYQAKTVVYGSIVAGFLGIREVYPLIAGIGSVFLSNDVKGSIVKWVLTIEYRYAMKFCEKIFFQNEDDIRLFVALKIVERKDTVLLRGSGVNLEKFQVQKLPREIVFLFMGRLIRDKGICEYLEACKIIKMEFPKVRCLLLGGYDTNPSALTKEELKPFIKSGVIEYFGEQLDVRPFFAQCSVFVLPSYREGTPKAVLEAMACGKAIITTDVPGCRETVEDGKNGYLIEAKNVSALVAKMKQFINNPGLVKDMALVGRKLVEDVFDVNKVNQVIAKTMKL